MRLRYERTVRIFAIMVWGCQVLVPGAYAENSPGIGPAKQSSGPSIPTEEPKSPASDTSSPAKPTAAEIAAQRAAERAQAQAKEDAMRAARQASSSTSSTQTSSLTPASSLSNGPSAVHSAPAGLSNLGLSQPSALTPADIVTPGILSPSEIQFVQGIDDAIAQISKAGHRNSVPRNKLPEGLMWSPAFITTNGMLPTTDIQQLALSNNFSVKKYSFKDYISLMMVEMQEFLKKMQDTGQIPEEALGSGAEFQTSDPQKSSANIFGVPQFILLDKGNGQAPMAVEILQFIDANILKLYPHSYNLLNLKSDLNPWLRLLQVFLKRGVITDEDLMRMIYGTKHQLRRMIKKAKEMQRQGHEVVVLYERDGKMVPLPEDFIESETLLDETEGGNYLLGRVVNGSTHLNDTKIKSATILPYAN